MPKKKARLFYGSFIEKGDADKRAKKHPGAKVRKIKMRGRTRYQVYEEC